VVFTIRVEHPVKPESASEQSRQKSESVHFMIVFS
jgi:hypothetical protein